MIKLKRSKYIEKFHFLQDYSGSEEDYDESESVEDYVDETNPVKRKANIEIRAKRKKRPASIESESDEYDERDDDDDEDDEDGGGFSMPDVGEFFGNVGNMFTPIGSYVPSFLFFGGKGSKDDDDTRPPPSLRRTKHKKSSQRYETPDLYLNRIEDGQEKTNRWYDSFFYGSTEEDDATSTTSPTPASSTESESFFDWLNGESNEVGTTESANAASAENSNLSKFKWQPFSPSREAISLHTELNLIL